MGRSQIKNRRRTAQVGAAANTSTGRGSKANVASPSAERPTPEQEQRVEFRMGPVSDEMGKVLGRAYRRRPTFETLADRGDMIGRDELSALQFYRGSFDRCDRSPTSSCLNVGAGGRREGGSGAVVINASPSIIEAKRKVRLCEDALGSTLSTMRAVVLDDRSFSEIAIDRFGGRKQGWLIDEAPSDVQGGPARKVFRDKVVPRSGRHREIIRQEFIAGMAMLLIRVRALVATNGVEELWVQPEDDGTATIRRGGFAPNGLYRLWGDSGQVDTVMKGLYTAHGELLAFESPVVARQALGLAAGGQLVQLEAGELAA